MFKIYGNGSEESKAEIITANGRVVAINLRRVANRRPLSGSARTRFIEFVRAKAPEILEKWTAVFVLNQEVKTEKITRRIR
jgi:hypothetical protein